MTTSTATCRHTSGFRSIHVVDPQPGEPPEVLRGACRDCGKTRFFDRHAAVYLSAEDARARRNPERRAGE